MDFSFLFSLFYNGECKCAFHYLSSYCKNVYFTLPFFSNACYYLGVHLNSDLTAYHFHMLEHILKCLLKEPVLNTNYIHFTLQQGCLLIIIHIKSCFLWLCNNTRKRKGQKGKDAQILWNLVKYNCRLHAISRCDLVKFHTFEQNYRAVNNMSSQVNATFQLMTYIMQ